MCYTYNMNKISSLEFQRHFGRYQDQAMQAPIAITRHNRPQLVVMSIAAYEALRKKGRKSMHVTELSDAELQTIQSSKVPTEHAHLDDD
jgi:prevent-host-death family protein